MKKFLLVVLLAAVFSASVFAVPDRPSVAVVLSGGGAKGIAHIALLEEMEKLGIPVDCIMGTSMGALIAGLYAAGYTPGEIRELIKNTNLVSLFTEIETSGYKELKEPFQYYKPRVSLSLDNGVVGVSGLIDDYKIMNFFYDSIGNIPEDIDFDNLPVRFRCVAMNAVTGKAKVFDRGSLVDAMRASMSIPFVFAPKEIDGELYVDGGLVDNMPINLAKEMGYDIVIAENVNGKFIVSSDSYNSLSGVYDGLSRVLIDNTINDQMKNADIVLNPDLRGFTVLGFNDPDAIIKRGEDEINARRVEIEQIASLFSESQKVYKDKNRTGDYFLNYSDRDIEHQKSTVKMRAEKAYSKSRVSIGSRLPGYYTFKMDEDNTGRFMMNPTFDIDLFLRHLGKSKYDLNMLLSIGKVVTLKPDFLFLIHEGRNVGTYLEGGFNLNFGTQTHLTDNDSIVSYNKSEFKLGGSIGVKVTDERVLNLNMRILADYYNVKSALFATDEKEEFKSLHYFYPRIEIAEVANDIFDARILNSDGFRIDFQSVIGIIKEKLTYKISVGVEDEFFFKDENHSLTLDFRAATSREPKLLRESYYEYGGVNGIPGYGTDAYFSDFIMCGAIYRMPLKIGKGTFYLEFATRSALRSGDSGYDIDFADDQSFWFRNKIADSLAPFHECFGGRGEWDIGGSIAIGHESQFGDFQIGFGLNNHLQAAVYINLQ